MFFVPIILGIGAILVLVWGTPSSDGRMEPSDEPQRARIFKEPEPTPRREDPVTVTSATSTVATTQTAAVKPDHALVSTSTGQVTSVSLSEGATREIPVTEPDLEHRDVRVWGSNPQEIWFGANGQEIGSG